MDELDLDQILKGHRVQRGTEPRTSLSNHSMWMAGQARGRDTRSPADDAEPMLWGKGWHPVQGRKKKGRGRKSPDFGSTPLLGPLLCIACTLPMGGQLGWHKTEARLTSWVFCSGIYRMVEEYCQECPACQKTRAAKPLRALLMPLPLAGWPFYQIAMDIAGPFPGSQAGYQFVLAMTNYETRFPEAVPLRSFTTTKITEALIKWIAWVNIPQGILTNQGKNFMLTILKGVCKTVQIKQLRMVVYHPQADDLDESFTEP